eukprot:5992828-Prymnesium_polylepis.1
MVEHAEGQLRGRARVGGAVRAGREHHGTWGASARVCRREGAMGVGFEPFGGMGRPRRSPRRAPR